MFTYSTLKLFYDRVLFTDKHNFSHTDLQVWRLKQFCCIVNLCKHMPSYKQNISKTPFFFNYEKTLEDLCNEN